MSRMTSFHLDSFQTRVVYANERFASELPDGRSSQSDSTLSTKNRRLSLDCEKEFCENPTKMYGDSHGLH